MFLQVLFLQIQLITDLEIKTKYESNTDTNAFTDSEKNKLSGIESNAEVNVNSDWNSNSGDSEILNKPSDLTDLSLHSIDELNDVNITGVSNGSFLRWNNTEFLIFKPLYVCDLSQDFNRPSQTTEGLMNQGSQFEKYLTIVADIDETGFYEITTAFVWSHNVNNDNFLAELVINDDAGSPEIRIRFLSLESKDIAGPGQVVNVISNGNIVGNSNTQTDIRNPTQYSTVFMFTQGVEYTIDLEWRSQTTNDEATIYNGYLDIEQKIK